MLPNPIIHSRTAKVVALLSLLLSIAWTSFCSYQVYLDYQDEPLHWFISFTVSLAFLGIMGIQMALNLYKRPMLDNLCYSIGWFSYLITFLGVAWTFEQFEAAISMFLALTLGSALYYTLVRLFSKPAGFSPQPFHSYFSNALPTLLTFFFWTDSFRFASYLDSEKDYISISFLGSILFSVGFYLLSSHFLKTPKEVTTSEKQPLADKASL